VIARPTQIFCRTKEEKAGWFQNVYFTQKYEWELTVCWTMDIWGSLILLILAIVVAIIIYYLLKTVIALVINAIVGIILLFLINVFNVMELFGAPDIPIDWITVLVSAIGGLVGVILVVILHLAGVAL
jgi:SigmaK-factor processing regulatory protein BofA